MKALGNMERIQITNEVIALLLSLYESKGKSFYYDELFSRDLNSFQKNVLENDIYALGKLLSLGITDARLKALAKKNLSAKNNNETLLLNLKKILITLQKYSEDFELLSNEIIDMSKYLCANLEPIVFNTFEEITLIGERAKKTSKRVYLDELLTLLSKQIHKNSFELTQLIVNFYVDFLELDIFSSKNDLLGLLIVYALLLKHFGIFKYTSFFESFVEIKNEWHAALIQARHLYASGFAQTDFLSRLLITLLMDAYKKVNDIAYVYEFEKDLNKSDNIENTIMKFDGIFSKEDIRTQHPNVSDATIDRTLKRLRDNNIIRPLGKGRSSKWQRIVEGHQKKVYQINIFD